MEICFTCVSIQSHLRVCFDLKFTMLWALLQTRCKVLFQNSKFLFWYFIELTGEANHCNMLAVNDATLFIIILNSNEKLYSYILIQYKVWTLPPPHVKVSPRSYIIQLYLGWIKKIISLEKFQLTCSSVFNLWRHHLWIDSHFGPDVWLSFWLFGSKCFQQLRLVIFICGIDFVIVVVGS